MARRVPNATMCLISALALHELTTQIPHEVQIALPRGSKAPRLAHPPLRVFRFRFSGPALTEGIETRSIDAVKVKIYVVAKTVADCFRLRNKIGLDVAIEGLKSALQDGKARRAELLYYARMCKVERVMLPYLEALQ